MGLYFYTGLDYTLFLQRQDDTMGFHDFQLSSGLIFRSENFLVNSSWRGSLLKGHYTIEGLDQVLDDGDREIDSNDFLNGFQMDFSSDYLSSSLLILDREEQK